MSALPGGTTLPTSVNHEWGGAIWQTTPALAITGAVYHANANDGNGNATLFTLGGTCSLSKRTLLYTELGYVRNSSTSNLGLNGGVYGANTTTPRTAAHPAPIRTMARASRCGRGPCDKLLKNRARSPIRYRAPQRLNPLHKRNLLAM